MIDYYAQFNSNGSAFPNTQAINVSTPGAGDGTEFKAILVNDLWGVYQNLMSYANKTPNGSSEAYGFSQIYDSLLALFVPVGSIIMTHSNNNPSTLGYRFLELTGSPVLRALYPDLDSACYVGDGLNGTADYWYRSDDASGLVRNIAGVYLQTADMRGAFVRGRDPTATRDPDGGSRIFPDFQQFSFQTHKHEVNVIGNGKFAADARIIDPGTTFTGFESQPLTSSLVLEADENISKAGTPDVEHNLDETRSCNVQVKYWIRY
jgi:hypothetical protein